MRTTKTKLMSVALASALMPAALLGVTLAAPSEARAAVSKAHCQVHAVLASKEGDGSIPKELDFLRDTLKNDEFAAYKGFHLLEKKTVKLKLEERAKLTLKSGNALALTLLGGDDTKLKLHAELSSRDGSKSLLSTDYSIEDHGLFMIGAGNHSEGALTGKLFVAIQCARKT
jgi:hypothetical protein